MCSSEIVFPEHDLGLPGANQSSNTLPIYDGEEEAAHHSSTSRTHIAIFLTLQPEYAKYLK
jgi:hypothetical protein